MQLINIRKKITVTGIVQGVGFRPAIARRAMSVGLSGHVINTRDSVEIEIEGPADIVLAFENDFYSFIPGKAVINSYESAAMEPAGSDKSFNIVESREQGPARFSIPPDISICEKCLAEFNDPSDRRFKYAFITCGECGPRYTYMRDMPYDRKRTTMSDFPMCSRCLAEYNDPGNRRFHIEGFSCPDCGPVTEGFDETVNALKKGKIASIKGLGGYHIACSAVDESAVVLLRQRKRRKAKPFAVMFASVEMAGEYLHISRDEVKCLQSAVSPILIIRKNFKKELAPSVAPDNGYLGIMIAYTPLHRLILDAVGEPLIMTSANIAGDPLIIDDDRALTELSEIVDVSLVHNREILRRADDSISWIHGGDEISVRMGRGRMPFPLKIENSGLRKILALGAELKSNISIVSGSNLVTSNHIGDLATPETFAHFHDTVDEMIDYYQAEPDLIVADRHPDYESTSFARDYAEERDIEIKQVQHHYAHFLSAYFENKLVGRAAGIIFDGTGYGEDGTIWGGEFFTGDLHSFTREGHLGCFSLPGGERAIHEPWRILAGLLEREDFFDICSSKDEDLLENIFTISQNRKFSPLTSSAGRLFDAAGVLLGFGNDVSYEAQAAIYLEAKALESETPDFLEMPLVNDGGIYIPDTAGFFRELNSMRGGDSAYLARLFHNSLIEAGALTAERICSKENIENVVLSGGVFQNRIMLYGLEKRLASMGLRVFFNKKIPANDAGISAGQAIYGVYNA